MYPREACHGTPHMGTAFSPLSRLVSVISSTREAISASSKNIS